ncbi:phylloplanin [Eucalyptus grandis]|uniref:Uncharacterized protein n=2 Tax=Eucalyptus grandis TaxID=71139 RepID=A0ACC3JV29_EUCGR|nr:phylloplanin [Eucalyptus grandis]KAK3417961.1 hypothetical protein EUGRSUZ_H03941 [Eucalyptus grandis]
MALKSLFLMSLIVGVLAVGAPMAQAQLGGVGGIIGSLLGLIRINGIVPCLLNSATSLINGTIPLFPNAVVQLKCGGNVVSTATTNQNGVFSILLDPLQYVLSTVLNTCQLVVPTPLSSCNSALPVTGVLQSALQLAGNTLQGLLSITNIVPTGFNLIG